MSAENHTTDSNELSEAQVYDIELAWVVALAQNPYRETAMTFDRALQALGSAVTDDSVQAVLGAEYARSRDDSLRIAESVGKTVGQHYIDALANDSEPDNDELQRLLQDAAPSNLDAMVELLTTSTLHGAAAAAIKEVEDRRRTIIADYQRKLRQQLLGTVVDSSERYRDGDMETNEEPWEEEFEALSDEELKELYDDHVVRFEDLDMLRDEYTSRHRATIAWKNLRSLADRGEMRTGVGQITTSKGLYVKPTVRFERLETPGYPGEIGVKFSDVYNLVRFVEAGLHCANRRNLRYSDLLVYGAGELTYRMLKSLVQSRKKPN